LNAKNLVDRNEYIHSTFDLHGEGTFDRGDFINANTIGCLTKENNRQAEMLANPFWQAAFTKKEGKEKEQTEGGKTQD
jgi:hypothetical protein